MLTVFAFTFALLVYAFARAFPETQVTRAMVLRTASAARYAARHSEPYRDGATGQPLNDTMTVSDACVAIDAAWNVVSVPMESPAVMVTGDHKGNGAGVVSPDLSYWSTHHRSDTGGVLGVGATKKYKVVHNVPTYQATVGAALTAGTLAFYAGGLLRANPHTALGSVVWFLFRLPETAALPVARSMVRALVLVTLTHDGSGRVRFDPFATDAFSGVVLPLAFAHGVTSSFQHSGDTDCKLRGVCATIGATVDAFATFATEARYLASVPCDADTFVRFVGAAFPATKTDDDGRAQYTGRAARAIDYAAGYFAPFNGATLYDAFRAVAAWFDFGQWDGSRRRADTRFANTFRGDGATAKRNLWRFALTLADESNATD